MGNKVVSWGGGALSGSQGGGGAHFLTAGQLRYQQPLDRRQYFHGKYSNSIKNWNNRITWTIVYDLNVIYDATFGFFCSLW